MKEHERVVIEKIKKYAIQTMQFADNQDFLSFNNDAKTTAACVFNLGQIGELTSKLSDDFMDKTGNIPWRKMKSMRNRIVHDYEGVQLTIVWDVITEFLPTLINDIDNLL